MSKYSLAMALRAPSNRTVAVSATATGRLFALEKLFGSATTFVLAVGTNANLQLDNGDGIKAVAALGVGVSQDAIVQVSDGGSRMVQYKITCSGAPVAPSVPAVTVAPGNAQITVAWTDGSNGGSAITSHRIYVNGALVASPAGASPYVITGLTNGTTYSVQVSAVNGVGEGALSSAQSATPTALVAPSNTDMLFYGDSRIERPISTNRNASGITNSQGAQGMQSWVPALSGHKLRLGLWGHCGISGTTSANWLTNPRQNASNQVLPANNNAWRSTSSTANKGSDDVAAHPAGIVVLMDPTNDGTLDINTTYNQIVTLINRFRTAGKVVFLSNGTPRDINLDGSLAGSTITNNAQRLILKDMFNKLDCQSGDATAMPGVYVFDTYTAFQDSGSPTPFRNKAGLLGDALHDNILGGKLRSKALIDRLSTLAWYQALPARITLPTTDGLVSQGRTQGAQAPYINPNPIMTPGNAGTVAGTYAGTAPVGADIVESWRLTSNPAAGNSISIAATKGIKNARNDWVQKLVVSGTLLSATNYQISFETQLSSSFLAAEVAANRLSLTDTLRAMGWFYVAPGAQGLFSVSLANSLQMDASSKSQLTTVFGAPLTGEGWSNVSNTDPGGEWVLAQTDDIRVSDVLLDPANGGPGLPTAFGNNSTLIWRISVGVAAAASAQTVAFEVQFGPAGLYRVV